MKYLIFDATGIGKPKSYKVPATDTFNWPRMIHLSWIILDENLKPIEDYDCIVKPEGFAITPAISKYAKIDEEDIKTKGEELKAILEKFGESLDKVDYVFSHNLNGNECVVGAEFVRKGMKNKTVYANSYCLMQETTWFCKIPSKTGGYKWPSLTQLHSICFNSGYSPINNARADVIAATRCFIALMKTRHLEDIFELDE